MSADPGLDDGWAGADDLCDAILEIVVDGVAVRLRCEVEGDHEEHEVNLHWKARP